MTELAGSREVYPTGTYRGVDRRQAASTVERGLGWPFRVTAAAVPAVLLVALLRAPAAAAPETVDTVLLGAYLQAATVTIGIAGGLLALHRWWIASEAAALAIGLALLTFSAFPLAMVDLAPTLLAASESLLAATVRPAGLVVVALLGTQALAGDRVSPRQDLLRHAASAVLAMALMAVILGVLPPLAWLLHGQAVAMGEAVLPEHPGTVAVALAAVGALLMRAGHLRRRRMWAWAGLWLLALAAAEALRPFSTGPGTSTELTMDLLVLLSVACAAWGAGQQLLITNAEQSRTAAGHAASARLSEARRQDEQRRAEERAHEARSALAAIEGATRTLQHHRDRLPAEAQRSLAEAVSGEIRRLQALVSPAADFEPVKTLQLAALLSPLVATEQGRGTRVTFHVPASVLVRGFRNATTEIVQTLFDNCRVHASGSPLNVTASSEDGWVVLRVEDRGPGVAAAEREAIFQRGVRGSSSWDVDGSGLGLYVAARLAQNAGGQLWVEDRPGGGASFVLALPSDQPSHDVDEGGHVADVHDLYAARRVRSA